MSEPAHEEIEAATRAICRASSRFCGNPSLCADGCRAPWANHVHMGRDKEALAAILVAADRQRMDWLENQIVDVIYLDDGTIIDVRGNSIRAAIDRVIEASAVSATESKS